MKADILTQIVDATRAALGDENRPVSEARTAAADRRRNRIPHAFASALRGGRNTLTTAARIIAEVKAASPSAGDIAPDPEVEAIASSYQTGGAAAISVVTEPRFFKGSRSWLQRAYDVTLLPVIMKDFIVDEVQLYEGVAAGADAILLLASTLDSRQIAEFTAILNELGVDALVEVHDERELDVALEANAQIVGVNNRDLRDFSVSLQTSERLVERIPAETIRVSESGIRSRNDVERLTEAGYDAFLVGESLLRQSDRAAAVSSLARGGPVQR